MCKNRESKMTTEGRMGCETEGKSAYGFVN